MIACSAICLISELPLTAHLRLDCSCKDRNFGQCGGAPPALWRTRGGHAPPDQNETEACGKMPRAQVPTQPERRGAILHSPLYIASPSPLPAQSAK
ncbi:hypothetical protein LSTR_LSTR004544 [Laodelphax striatellus]|uniref:Secreted protein n=1 Tax=Laodelphax striatellus TaxID=195883 RepID=A0A482WU82_LAOST|nr:hypothetical protein LSTR_LSTR004544 [Laodelphax striatellus]